MKLMEKLIFSLIVLSLVLKKYDMAYKNFKYLPRKIDSDKALREKAFNIDKNHEYNRHQRVLTSMVSKYFDKTYATHKRTGINSDNQQLADKLQKPIN